MWMLLVLFFGFCRNIPRASEMVTPVVSGTLYVGPLKTALTCSNPCWQQAGVHVPKSSFCCVKLLMALSASSRYLFMSSMSVQLQLSREKAPLVDCFIHFLARVTETENSSQDDWIRKIWVLYRATLLLTFKHWKFSQPAAVHYCMGIPVSLLTMLKRDLSWSTRTDLFVAGFGYSSRNSPESGIEQTFFLVDLSQTQLLHKKVARPPADSPVMTIVVALKKSCLSSRNLKCARVLFIPRKKRSRPRYLEGEALVP